MRPLPNLTTGAFALALAALLGASSAQASQYTDDVNNELAVLYPGKNLNAATCAVSQLQAATLAVIAAHDPTNAGHYVHDVLALRTDRNAIAVNLVTGALASGTGSAVATSSATLAASIAGFATATDLQQPTVTASPLTLLTIEKITTGVVKKMPATTQSDTALNVGDLVSQNLTPSTGDPTKYATDVILTLPNIAVQGRFAGGIGRNIADWQTFIKTLDTKAPKAAGEICYSVVALSGGAASDRIAASGTACINVATLQTPAQKGLIAQGFVKASGTDLTAQIINNVLNTDRNTAGKEVLYSNIASFTSAVAGAVAKDLTMDQAEAIMRIITNTIASDNNFRKGVTLPTITLSGADRAAIAAAAVKVAPVSLAGADKTINPPNPANAAIQGVLASGSIGDPYVFAVTAAKGASNYENAGQVANAVASSLTASGTFSTAPAAYLGVASAVIKALPKTAAAVSQRVAQLILPDPSSMSQAGRIDLAVKLSTTYAASASLIATGISNTDPQYADAVTSAVLSIPGTAGNSIRNNAAKVAGSVANTIPAEYACEVSQATGALIASGTLKVSQASAIAKAIAQASSVKNNQEELQVVSAQMIGQLLNLYVLGNPADAASKTLNTTIVNAIAAVAKSVSQVAYTSNSTKSNPTGNVDQNTRFVNDIAGSSAQIVVNNPTDPNTNHHLSADDVNRILGAIQTAVLAVTPTLTGDNAVKAAIATAQTSNTYATLCDKLNTEETPVTNY